MLLLGQRIAQAQECPIGESEEAPFIHERAGPARQRWRAQFKRRHQAFIGRAFRGQVAPHAGRAASRELLVGHQRARRQLEAAARKQLPIAAKVLGVGQIAAQQREAGAGHVALVVEVFFAAAHAEHAARGRDQAHADRALRNLRIAIAVVRQRERQILERHAIAVIAETDLLVEILVVQAEGETVVPIAQRLHAVGRHRAKRVAAAQHIGASDGGHVAVGLVARELQAPAVGQGHGVRARPNPGVGRLLGRGEKGQRECMAALPQVVMAEREHGAQLLGVGAVIVVQARAGAPGAFVFDLEVDVHGAGELALPHQRHDLAAGRTVERRQLDLRLIEVGHLAFLQRRHLFADLQRRIVLRAHHAQTPHLGLGHLQNHDPARHLLLGQVDVHGLITFLVIAVLQSITGRLDVGHRAFRPEEWVDGFFDIGRVEHRVAAHDVFADVDAALVRLPGRRRGSLVCAILGVGAGLHAQRQQCRAQDLEPHALSCVFQLMHGTALNTGWFRNGDSVARADTPANRLSCSFTHS